MHSKKIPIINISKNKRKLPNFIWAIILSLIFMYGGSLMGSLATVPLFLALRNITLFFNNKDFLSLVRTLFAFPFIS